jgi:hypothetical protein
MINYKITKRTELCDNVKSVLQTQYESYFYVLYLQNTLGTKFLQLSFQR